jgi:hypothetical protein
LRVHPFSITLFATTGDPEGVRHVNKSNWSGCGVVFTRDSSKALKQEPGISQAGIYIVVGNAAEETIYIGEARPAVCEATRRTCGGYPAGLAVLQSA